MLLQVLIEQGGTKIKRFIAVAKDTAMAGFIEIQEVALPRSGSAP